MEYLDVVIHINYFVSAQVADIFVIKHTFYVYFAIFLLVIAF
jgi:hypothetical protein